MPHKKNIDLTVKIDCLLNYQIKNMKVTLSIPSSCKKSRHSSLLPKIDFVERTCPINYKILWFCSVLTLALVVLEDLVKIF